MIHEILCYHSQLRRCCFPLFSDEPLLWGRLDHVVQLQPGRGELLRGRLVLALRLALLARHEEKDEETDDGNEEHPANDGADDQRNVASATSGLRKRGAKYDYKYSFYKSLHKMTQNKSVIQWCQTNFSSIEDIENCQNRGGFRQNIESIEEILWFSAPLK
jgi:hypothetical protein